ncbi:MAG: transcription antitermination factor NusB [Bacteroidales bacterium]|jgi:N utilization substance protein B|nr:transcription antitermination factor NusB [Bacteroidales bacterium]
MISRRLLRIKVMQVYYSNLLRENGDLELAVKELDNSVHYSLELYYELLAIITYMANYAEQKIATALEKRLPTEADLNPNRRFVDNPVIEGIRNADCFKKQTKAPRIPFDAHKSLIKNLWNDFTATTEYQRYMIKQSVGLQEHKEIIAFFIREYFPENETIDSLIEEHGIYWNDDIGFASSLLEKSIMRFKRPTNDAFLIMKEYSCEADRRFGKQLLVNAMKHDKEFENLIDHHSKNWDVERIAIIDRIIMKLAITEFMHLPDVPIKVTINEYLEISKFYSTEKSNAFINGLLDQIVTALKAEDKINKSARGLVDNSI